MSRDVIVRTFPAEGDKRIASVTGVSVIMVFVGYANATPCGHVTAEVASNN